MLIMELDRKILSSGKETFKPLRQIFVSYRNQSIVLQGKSTDWFLYGGRIGLSTNEHICL